MRAALVRAAAVAALFVVFAHEARAQVYCGQNGFSHNNASAAKSYRCTPGELVRGSSPITTSSGSGTATSSGAFTFAASGDAPGAADNVAVSVTGLTIVANNIRYWFRVSAKASNSSITIQDGNANPTITGTWPEWSYWTSTCYRAAVDGTTTDVGVLGGSPLVWGESGLRSSYYQHIFWWARLQAGSSTNANLSLFYRLFNTARSGIYGGVTAGTSGSVSGTESSFNIRTLNSVPLSVGADYQIVTRTETGQAYVTACILRGPFTGTAN